MINSTKSVILLAIISIFSNCSQVLQTIDLEVNSKDTISQQEFKIVEKTLTISLAQKLKDEPYIRHVIQTSNNSDPKPILESVAMISNFPKRNEPEIT